MPGDIKARHRAERVAMFQAHRTESRDMSGNHGEEQRQMASRHEKPIADLHEKHERERTGAPRWRDPPIRSSQAPRGAATDIETTTAGSAKVLVDALLGEGGEFVSFRRVVSYNPPKPDNLALPADTEADSFLLCPPQVINPTRGAKADLPTIKTPAGTSAAGVSLGDEGRSNPAPEVSLADQPFLAEQAAQVWRRVCRA